MIYATNDLVKMRGMNNVKILYVSSFIQQTAHLICFPLYFHYNYTHQCLVMLQCFVTGSWF